MQIGLELDTSRPRKDGTCRLRVTLYRGSLARYPLDFCVKPDQWDHKRQRVKFGTPNHLQRNAVIEQTLQRAEAIALEEPGISPQALRDRLRSPAQGHLLLHEVLAQHVRDNAHRLAFGTRKGRNTVVVDVAEALPLATLHGLNISQVMDLDRYYVNKGLSQNTRRSRLRRLRTMYRSACKMSGVPPKDLFDGIIPEEEEVKARSLSAGERDALFGATLSGNLALARDAWALSYHLGGIRVGDLCRLRPEMIDEQGVEWIAGKVKRIRWAPINPSARAILDRYAGGRMCLPLIKPDLSGDAQAKAIESATAQINLWLSQVCEALKIRKVTMHMARHTWAQQAQNKTKDIRAVSRILGHGRVSTTERYLSRLDREADKDVFDLMGE